MKKRSRFLAFAAFLAILAQGGRARAQASLGFTNGSFESGVSGQVSAFTSSTGWNTWLGPATAGSDYGVAMSSTPPKVAEDGGFYAFFHANQNITDCIGQELNTVVGQQYTVSFWWATDGATTAQSTQLQVSWGPDFAADGNDVVVTPYQGTSATALPYQHTTVSFTALIPHPILAFHGFDATSDILLDNVTVTPEADGGSGADSAAGTDASATQDAATSPDAGASDAKAAHDAESTQDSESTQDAASTQDAEALDNETASDDATAPRDAGSMEDATAIGAGAAAGAHPASSSDGCSIRGAGTGSGRAPALLLAALAWMTLRRRRVTRTTLA